MDPNATLAEIRRLTLRGHHAIDMDRPVDPDDAARMLDLVDALHTWLSRGGVRPTAWSNACYPLRGDK